MPEGDDRKRTADKRQWSDRIRESEARMLRGKKRRKGTIWAGFAVSGLIGWSVVVPTLSGVMLGLWIDSNYPSKHSWTLTLLVTGLFFGCLNAWRWIAEENKNMHRED
jgi:ATP synthase protein I